MARNEKFNVMDNLMNAGGVLFGRNDDSTSEPTPSVPQPEPEQAKVVQQNTSPAKGGELKAPPKKEESNQKSSSGRKASAAVAGYSLDSLYEKKEKKSIKKTYLLLPSVYNKLEAAADKYGVTQNELVNEILKQVLCNEK